MERRKCICPPPHRASTQLLVEAPRAGRAPRCKSATLVREVIRDGEPASVGVAGESNSQSPRARPIETAGAPL